jgi:hypothetical protein
MLSNVERDGNPHSRYELGMEPGSEAELSSAQE